MINTYSEVYTEKQKQVILTNALKGEIDISFNAFKVPLPEDDTNYLKAYGYAVKDQVPTTVGELAVDMGVLDIDDDLQYTVTAGQVLAKYAARRGRVDTEYGLAPNFLYSEENYETSEAKEILSMLGKYYSGLVGNDVIDKSMMLSAMADTIFIENSVEIAYRIEIFSGADYMSFDILALQGVDPSMIAETICTVMDVDGYKNNSEFIVKIITLDDEDNECKSIVYPLRKYLYDIEYSIRTAYMDTTCVIEDTPEVMPAPEGYMYIEPVSNMMIEVLKALAAHDVHALWMDDFDMNIGTI